MCSAFPHESHYYRIGSANGLGMPLMLLVLLIVLFRSVVSDSTVFRLVKYVAFGHY
jgi:hypothetical protein